MGCRNRGLTSRTITDIDRETILKVRDFKPDNLDVASVVWSESFASSAPDGVEGQGPKSLAQILKVEVEAGNWVVRLAWVDERVAGLLAIEPSTNCLRQLFIAPEFQGMGTGKALLDEAKERLGPGLWLRTAKTNSRAQRFYEREGLVVAGCGKHPIHGHDIITYKPATDARRNN